MDKFEIYQKLLLEWNEKMNLTAITQPEEIRVKHFEDSLTCLKTGYIKDNDKIIDVGTGAGFPGLPIKFANDTVKLTLMDSLNKRLIFLGDVLSKTNTEAQLVHMRAEDGGADAGYREKFDVACSRAVASLCVLCEYCLPFVKVGGYFLAMKGREYEDELKSAGDIITRLGGRVKEVQMFPLSGNEIVHSIIIIEKIAPTPKTYPRKGKKIGK